MTAEDQDAVVGRLVRERHELRTRHEALTATLQKIGDLLSSVGHALRGKPEYNRLAEAPILRIDDRGSVTVSDEYRNRQMLTGDFPTADKIKKLVDEREIVAARLSDLDGQLKVFGV